MLRNFKNQYIHWRRTAGCKKQIKELLENNILLHSWDPCELVSGSEKKFEFSV